MNENQNIQQLPKDWKWMNLGEVCEKVETVKRKDKKPEEELLYLDIGGIGLPQRVSPSGSPKPENIIYQS